VDPGKSWLKKKKGRTADVVSLGGARREAVLWPIQTIFNTLVTSRGHATTGQQSRVEHLLSAGKIVWYEVAAQNKSAACVWGAAFSAVLLARRQV